MIDDGMDTGHIIYREQCRILDTDTAGDVHDKLMETGAKVVVQTVDSIIDKDIELRLQKSFIQGSEVLHPAPKLSRELCHIDWNDSTRHIYNLIRGLSPAPAAFTELTSEGNTPVQLKIFSSEQVTGEDYRKMLAENGLENTVPGTVLSDGKTYMAITTLDGAISITDLQLSGKRRMDIKDFLIGFRDPTSYGTTQGTSAAILENVRNA